MGVVAYVCVHKTAHAHTLQSPSPEAVQDPSRPLPQRRAATKATKKLAALVIPVDTPAASLPLPSNSTNISTPSPSPSTQEVGVVSITAELRAAFIRKEIVECPHEVMFGFGDWIRLLVGSYDDPFCDVCNFVWSSITSVYML